MSKRKQFILVGLLVFLLVLIDQCIKVYVKTHFAMHECVDVLPWFKLVFIENNGMAFGMEFGAKIFLTLFRIVACGAGVWYIWREIRRGTTVGYLVVLSLILAGAIGNIVDCMFYGLIFDSPAYGTPFATGQSLATLVPLGEGNGTFLEGRVVDMFYFPLFGWDWPSWMPLCGGEHFIFFSPIFNFADSCITCGVFAFLIFYRKVLMEAED